MLLVPGCIEPETASTFVTQQPDPRSCVNPANRPCRHRGDLDDPDGPRTCAGALTEPPQEPRVTGLLLSGLVLRLRCHPSRVIRRVGHSTRYHFEALGLACLLATWSARSGPAEPQRLAPRPAPACEQELLAVEPQQVVLGKSEAADGRF